MQCHPPARPDAGFVPVGLAELFSDVVEGGTELRCDAAGMAVCHGCSVDPDDWHHDRAGRCYECLAGGRCLFDRELSLFDFEPLAAGNLSRGYRA